MAEGKDLTILSAAERFDSGARMSVDKVAIGQWYWVKHVVR